MPPGWNWYLPFGLDTPAKVYSLWYQRYMHRYDVTNVDFGLYPVVARKHAATNPNVFYYQQPLTLEEHQESRWIVEPILRKLDCCQESDGGVASSSPAWTAPAICRSDQCASTPPARVTCATATRCSATTAATSPASTRRAFLGQQLYEATGLTPDDIDVAMIYENFTPDRLHPTRGVRVLRPGRGHRLHRRRQHRGRRHRSR